MRSRRQRVYLRALASLLASAILAGGCVRDRPRGPADGAGPADAVAPGTAEVPQPWRVEWIGTRDPSQEPATAQVDGAFYLSARGPGQLLPGRQEDSALFVHQRVASSDASGVEISARIIRTGDCPDPDVSAARMGLMLRERPNESGSNAYLFFGVDGHGHPQGQYRRTRGAPAKSLDLSAIDLHPVNDPGSIYVRLIRRERDGNVTVAVSKNRWEWLRVPTVVDLMLGPEVHAGFVLAPSQSHCFAIFDRPRLRQSAVPVEWMPVEIGWGGTGQVVVNEETGSLTLMGENIRPDEASAMEAGDSLFFVARPVVVPREAAVRVRISSASVGEAGLMMRTTLDSVSAKIALLVDAGGTIRFVVRPDYDLKVPPAEMAQLPPDEIEGGVYLKIARTAEQVTDSSVGAAKMRVVVRGYWSTDGANWNEMHHQLIDSAVPRWFAGPAVSGDNVNATFDEFAEVEPGGTPTAMCTLAEGC